MLSNRFYRTHRLLTAEHFASVFQFHCTQSNIYFQIYTCPNMLEHPRLGLMVSKKIHKRAVRRNYIKRCIREWFRVNQHSLKNMDYIIRAKIPFTRTKRLQAVTALAALCTRADLRKNICCHTPSSS